MDSVKKLIAKDLLSIGAVFLRPEQRNKNYNMYVEAKLPKTILFPSMLKAFVVGGLICCFGQLVFDLYAYWFPSLSEMQLGTAMLGTIIAITAILTGFGVFDWLGAFGGAGTVIPITGFANAIVSPSVEFKKEGIIFGICVKMFTIAGPVIVCGIVASAIVGLIHLFI